MDNTYSLRKVSPSLTHEQILRPIAGGWLQRACACGQHIASNGGNCEDCKKKQQGMLQRAPVNNAVVSEVPPIVHEVLRSPGQPLDAATRAFMEPRFGHDFSEVRVHTDDKAAQSARVMNALAYTVGHEIIFENGRYAPRSTIGRALMAHELTHVIQQEQKGNQNSYKDRLEVEANHSAEMIERNIQPQIMEYSQPGVPQFYRKKIRGMEFEFGDIKLNAAASKDIRTHGNLLPSKDQGHIAVERGANNLGYDINYTNPEDSFRWVHLQDIIGKGKVDINAVGFAESFKSKVEINGQSHINHVNLAMFMASGMTLPTIPRQKAIDPVAKKYVGSDDDTRDKVYYETGKGGRGIIGSNALAHEFFGHLWLALQGVPFGHGKQIAAPAKGGTTPAILDPLGRTYSGSVDDYISKFAGASGKIIQSPTRFVGTSFLTDATAWILKEGASHLSWKTIKGQQQAYADPDFARRWETLSLNYEILLVGPQPSQTSPSLHSALGLVQWVFSWYSKLVADKKSIFEQVLNGLTWSLSSGYHTELAKAVLNTIKNPPNKVPTKP